MTMYHLHPPLRDDQGRPSACQCSACGQELFPGESVYHPHPGQTLCQECFQTYIKLLLWASPQGMARCLGMGIETLEEVGR